MFDVGSVRNETDRMGIAWNKIQTQSLWGLYDIENVGMGELGYRLFFSQYRNTINKIYKL